MPSAMSLEFEHGGLELLVALDAGATEDVVDERHQPLDGVLARDRLVFLGERSIQVRQKRPQEFCFRIVMVVERGFALCRLVGDVLHRQVREPAVTERAVGRFHDLLWRVRSFPGGIDFLAALGRLRATARGLAWLWLWIGIRIASARRCVVTHYQN